MRARIFLVFEWCLCRRGWLRGVELVFLVCSSLHFCRLDCRVQLREGGTDSAWWSRSELGLSFTRSSNMA